jgi:enediyne biosynthesis protein E4
MRPLVISVALVLAGCNAPTKPPVGVATSTAPLRDVAAEAGLAFTHKTGATGQFLMPEIMGAGAALFDFDDDGDLDALLLQSLPTENHRLYRNEGGGRFTDVTAGSGLRNGTYGMGAATGDFNNDGRVDLLLTAFGTNQLYRNAGGGRFEEVTQESPGVRLAGRWSSSAAFFDYDRDGWQDLVILNYVDYAVAANKKCYAPTGELDYCTPRVYRPLPARLFHNNQGRFTEVPKAFDKALGPGLGVVPLDANNDGWLDLFVANDSMANHLWLNQQNGTFLEKALESGVAFGEEGLAKAGMGVAPADYDDDGDEDLLVLNLMREGASLFRNNGPQGFADVSLATGVHAATFLYTGFGAGWLDADGDGRLDLFLANGAVTRREEQRGQAYPFAERNLLLRNNGGKFAAMPGLEETGVSRGAAFGDIDNDGDIDILLNVNNGAARLLRNESPQRQWLVVAAKPHQCVKLATQGQPTQTRWVRTSGSYLSASDPRVFFTLRSPIESLTIDGRPVDKPQPNTAVRAR